MSHQQTVTVDVHYPTVENIELGIINCGYAEEDVESNPSYSEVPSENPTEDVIPKESPDPTNEKQLQPSPQQEDPTPAVTSNPQDNDEGKPRDTWDSQMEFLLSCVAMSVGLAYENGGGAFLVPYFIVLLVFGRPMYYLEMCLGQFSSIGPVNIWEISPIFKGVGYASLLASCCTASFYCSIMAITVYYFFASFSSPLPWSEEVCNGTTLPATQNLCEMRTAANRSFSEIYFFSSVFPQLSSIENGLGVPHWKLAVCLMISWVVIYVFLVKGIKSAGKASYFTALFPYVVLIALLIRGITLPGAIDGINYFIRPDWPKLLNAKVWFSAVSQCFFSLNVGFGTIIFLSSHNRFRHNIYRDALVISITDTLTSCLAGVAIFSLLGYLANTMDTDVESVTRGGPGLAFVAFPESIAHLRFFPQVFAVLFFLMLFTLGTGSAMALSGQVVTVIRDLYPAWKKWKVALVVCTLGFISGIVYITPGGQFILTLVNHHGADFIIYTTGMIEIMAVSWVYGVNRFCDDIKFMLGRETSIYWKFCWAFVMPVGLFTLLIYFISTYEGLEHEGFQFPTLAIVCGWLLSGSILITLPICAIKAVASSPGSTWLEKVKHALKPLPSWGPKCPIEKAAWEEMRRNAQTKSGNNDQISNASTAHPASIT